MKKNFLVFMAFFLLSANFYQPLFANTLGFEDITMHAKLVPYFGLSLLSSSSVNLPSVVSNFDYIDTPNAAANDPWSLAAPVLIKLRVENDYPAGTLYIYTDHKIQTYWTSSANVNTDPTTPINGLINADVLTKDNWYLSTVPLRAWADYYQANMVTRNVTANWAWVIDKSSPNFSKQKLLYDYQSQVIKQNLDVYLRSCWSANTIPGTTVRKPKIAGNYHANIIIELESQ